MKTIVVIIIERCMDVRLGCMHLSRLTDPLECLANDNQSALQSSFMLKLACFI